MHISISDIVTLGIGLLYLYTIISTIAVVLLENRNPLKSAAWVLMLLLIPVGGLICYLILGQNFRKRKLVSKKSLKQIQNQPLPAYDPSMVDRQPLNKQQISLIKLLQRNSNAVPYPNSKITILANGKDTFDALFDAIEQAQNHIHIEFYIFEDDVVSNRLRELLIKKAQQGVRIRMIYDYLGSFKLGKRYIQSLVDAGVYVRPFMPLHFKWWGRAKWSKINFRNHRKIVVIDGKVAFTGGYNIADRYLYGNRLGMWRDTFVKFEGIAAHGLQTNFLVDWYFVEQKLITDKKYYPETPALSESNLVQFVPSGPDSDWENIMQGLAQIVLTATRYVYMHTPYFMPPEKLLSAIHSAALSGVDVRLLLPEKSDAAFSDAATRTYIERLLAAGVRVYFYQGGFLHSKAIVADDLLSSVGSANLDARSSNLNFELNAFIYDVDTAKTLRALFLEDVAKSREIKADEWLHRRRRERLKESVARLFSPLM